MNSIEVNKRIKEFSGIRENARDNNADLLEVALFVEDVFGLVLSDAEICKENLGTLQSIERFVIEKLNLEEPCAESAE